MSASNKGQKMSKQLPCSLVIERTLTVAGIERRAILSCGADQHHVYCPAYYQKFIDDAENKLAECEREKERISLQYGANLPATCDWGDCDEKATGFRYDEAGHGWLPICDGHNPLVDDLERKLAAAREAFSPFLPIAQRIVKTGYGQAILLYRDTAVRLLAALTGAGEGEK